MCKQGTWNSDFKKHWKQERKSETDLWPYLICKSNKKTRSLGVLSICHFSPLKKKYADIPYQIKLEYKSYLKSLDVGCLKYRIV